MDIRKGPWTKEEDSKLTDYITVHGEGDWNSVALCAGLKRNGKSCRFRWLNYLRPGIRRGNFTLQEQLIILRLHSRLGNRWSKIAQQLQGRTDNDIKNYWRTRVQKQAKHLNCDINSNQFRDTMRYIWLPRLLEQIGSSSSLSLSSSSPDVSIVQPITAGSDHSRCQTAVAACQVLQTGLGPAPHDPVITTNLSGFFLDPFEAQTPIIDNILNGRNWPINDFQDELIYSSELANGPSGYISQGLDIQSVDHSHGWLSDEYCSDIFFDDDQARWPSPALTFEGPWTNF